MRKRTQVDGSVTNEAVAPRRKAAGDVAATVVASIAIALPLVFYLHQHVEILRLGYEIESLKDRRVELSERSLELRIRRTEAARLARVEEHAAELGLRAPRPDAIYVAAEGATTKGSDGPRLTAKLD